jgi:hypothetical protein
MRILSFVPDLSLPSGVRSGARRAALVVAAAAALVCAEALAAPPAPASSSSAAAAPAPPPPPPAPERGDVQVPADHGLSTPLPDGVVVSFDAGAVARWRGASKIATETAKWAQGFHLELVDGDIDIAIPSPGKREHAILVTTKAGTVTGWRGRMHVATHGETTALSVYDGALIVGSNNQSFPVKDTTALVLRKGADADKARLLPSVPAWDDKNGSSLAVAPEGVGTMLTLAWTPVPGAVAYRLELAEDPAMTKIVRSTALGDLRFAVPAPAGTAKTWAHVRAVGADGLLSDWSPARALRVVHYRLPTGAFVARDGVVVLPTGASVVLTDAEAIEIAYENVRPGVPPAAGSVLYWTKLAGALHMADDAPLRIVHLRDAALGIESRLALARRQIRAEVDMQPRRAHASDPIDVRTVVSDPTGRVDVSTEAVTLEATVDLDVVPILWQRSANVWTGRIAPRRDLGRPSVVRVVVKDGLAQEIGRGFVETDSAAAASR